MNKSEILQNVENYSADDLVGFIRRGIITFEELHYETEGMFSAKVRKEVEQKLNDTEAEDWAKAKSSSNIELLDKYLKTYQNGSYREEARVLKRELQEQAGNEVEEQVWNAVDKNNIEALKEFCESNKGNPHCKEAKKLINEHRKQEFIGFSIEAFIQRIKAIETNVLVTNKSDKIYETIKEYLNQRKITQSDLLSMIQTDNNIFNTAVINHFIDDGDISYDDLIDIGIKNAFVQYLASGETLQGFSAPRKLDKINRLSTEVYFWGIPSSGKSCALGAILSVANTGMVARSMSMDNDCQGYGYMNRLASLFNSNDTVGILPKGTSIYTTYEMGFDLVDEKNFTHPLTCIDLAGELVRCMYKNDANEDMSTDEIEALDTLTRVLIDNRTKNRKIHFFVLEYGANDKKYDGLNQCVYLNAALQYIKRTGIFKSDTDAIYLMITKVDKANAGKGQLESILREYVSNAYGGFYNGLEEICRNCEINNGKVEIVPFSLGRVCFQDYCLFDERPASKVVRKLLDRSKGFKNGKMAKILSNFRR